MAIRSSMKPLVTTEDTDYEKAEKISDVIYENTDADVTSKKRRKISSIRDRSPSISSTLTDWSDINSTLAESKKYEQENLKIIHNEKMQLKKLQFEIMQKIEERKVICTEEESKCRILLLSAQVKKEEACLKKTEIELKVDLAHS